MIYINGWLFIFPLLLMIHFRYFSKISFYRFILLIDLIFWIILIPYRWHCRLSSRRMLLRVRIKRNAPLPRELVRFSPFSMVDNHWSGCRLFCTPSSISVAPWIRPRRKPTPRLFCHGLRSPRSLGIRCAACGIVRTTEREEAFALAPQRRSL